MRNRLLLFPLCFLLILASSELHAQKYDSTEKKLIDSLLPDYDLQQIDSLGHSFIAIQYPAAFRGGLKGWTAYLEKNLNRDLGAKYIKVRKGDTLVKQTVILTFTVQPSGLVSDVAAEPSAKGAELHPKIAAEAIRVVAEGPRWEPAQQETFEIVNGKLPMQEILARKKRGFKKVLYRHKQSITFVVSVEK
ncbi:MAG: hypothetical protein V4557_01575 [Bacteroidota bacterium]